MHLTVGAIIVIMFETKLVDECLFHGFMFCGSIRVHSTDPHGSTLVFLSWSTTCLLSEYQISLKWLNGSELVWMFGLVYTSSSEPRCTPVARRCCEHMWFCDGVFT